MRITIERSNLLKSLGHVHRVVERRNTIPILSNVALKAEGSALMMKATDLDLEITEGAPAMVEVAGATTVPAHLLYEIVHKLADGSEVSLSTNPEGSTMTVASGRSKFSLQCLPESDFPDLTAGTFSHTFKIKASDLKMLIERTQFAISTEETRYYLNGIFLHTMESDGALKLRAVATDGHRLARAEIEAPSGSEGMHSAQDRRRNPEAGRQSRCRDPLRGLRCQDPPVVRRDRADVQADRRHFPRLPAGHSIRQ